MGRATTTSVRSDGRGGHWTERKARDVLAELKASGETLGEFARRKGVTRQRLAYWAERLAPPGVAHPVPPGEARATMPTFVPIPLPTRLPAPSSAWIELTVEGVVVRVRETLDVEHVARLAHALTRRLGGPC